VVLSLLESESVEETPVAFASRGTCTATPIRGMHEWHISRRREVRVYKWHITHCAAIFARYWSFAAVGVIVTVGVCQNKLRASLLSTQGLNDSVTTQPARI
jgi:hypothetical protein